jgi:hypothetical protein
MEIAIAGYEVVLTVFTKDAFPEQWANTQYNLGNAYGKRIFGEEAQNIKLAIASLTNALELTTKDAFRNNGQWCKIIWGLFTATESLARKHKV